MRHGSVAYGNNGCTLTSCNVYTIMPEILSPGISTIGVVITAPTGKFGEKRTTEPEMVLYLGIIRQVGRDLHGTWRRGKGGSRGINGGNYGCVG